MVRVAAIQMTSTPDVAANLQTAGELLARAADAGAAIAALPENFAWMGRDDEQGKRDRRAITEADGRGPIQDFIARSAERHALWVIGGTIPLESGRDARASAACVVHDAGGRRVARYDKIHMFDVHVPGKDEHYRESASIAPGAGTVVVDTPASGLLRRALSGAVPAPGGHRRRVVLPAFGIHGADRSRALGNAAARPRHREPL
jgi:predicted amidohydrolase